MCVWKRAPQSHQTYYPRPAARQETSQLDDDDQSTQSDESYIAGEERRRDRRPETLSTYRRTSSPTDRGMERTGTKCHLLATRVVCTWQMPLTIRREAKLDERPAPPRQRSLSRGREAREEDVDAGAHHRRRRSTIASTTHPRRATEEWPTSGDDTPAVDTRKDASPPSYVPSYDYFATQDSYDFYQSPHWHAKLHQNYGVDVEVPLRRRPVTTIATPTSPINVFTTTDPPAPEFLDDFAHNDNDYEHESFQDSRDDEHEAVYDRLPVYPLSNGALPGLSLQIPENNNFVPGSPQRRKTHPQMSSSHRVPSSVYTALSSSTRVRRSRCTFGDDRDLSLFAEALSGFSDEIATDPMHSVRVPTACSQRLPAAVDDDDEEDGGIDLESPESMSMSMSNSTFVPMSMSIQDVDLVDRPLSVVERAWEEEDFQDVAPPAPLRLRIEPQSHQRRVVKQRKSRDRERQRTMFAEAIQGLFMPEAEFSAGEAILCS